MWAFCCSTYPHKTAARLRKHATSWAFDMLDDSPQWYSKQPMSISGMGDSQEFCGFLTEIRCFHIFPGSIITFLGYTVSHFLLAKLRCLSSSKFGVKSQNDTRYWITLNSCKFHDIPIFNAHEIAIRWRDGTWWYLQNPSPWEVLLRVLGATHMMGVASQKSAIFFSLGDFRLNPPRINGTSPGS